LWGLSPREEIAVGRHEFLMPPAAKTSDRSCHALDGAAIIERPRQLRRPLARSRRARRVDMRRSAFLKLVGCWTTGLFVLLVLVLAIRIFG